MKHIRFAAAIITVVLIACLFFPLANAEQPLQWDENQELRILIVADPQDTDHPQEATLNLLEAVLDKSKPHLVVLLGDIIHGSSTPGYEKTQKAIDAIVEPVVRRGIPFALVFGNHDNQSGLSNEEQLKIYQSYPGCLAVEGADLPGCGNYYILLDNPVAPESPLVLWFIDSGTYAEPGRGEYGYVKEEQNEWMLEEDRKLKEKYASPVSYVFQHIPVPQVYQMLKEVPFGTSGAVTCYGPNFLKWYLADPEHIFAGEVGEGPCSSEYDSGEFETWKSMGIRAAFFGHDHLNDYCGTYEGIDLIATTGLGFYLYGRGDEHGARVLTIHASDPSAYETKMLYYRDVVTAPLPGLFVSTLGILIRRYVFLGLCGLVIVILLIVYLIRRLKRWRKKRRASV